MSLDPSMAATVEVVAACQRLAAQLSELAAFVDHAASVTRAEWAGPHRETFDDRVVAVDRALLAAAETLNVLHRRIGEHSAHP